jgi:hypothetical protein
MPQYKEKKFVITQKVYIELFNRMEFFQRDFFKTENYDVLKMHDSPKRKDDGFTY